MDVMMNSSKNGNLSTPESLEDNRIKLAEERTELAALRTLFSAERTLSAWIRTGLAGVAGGLALTHLFEFESSLHKLTANFLGEVLIVWSMGIFFYSIVSYRSNCRRIEYSSSRRGNLVPLSLISFFAILLSILAFLMSLHRLFNYK